MKGNKILITGGCGYIGSHTILEIFRNTQYDVISIDNFINSSDKTIFRIKNILGKSVRNYNVDLRNYKETAKVFEEHKDEIIGIIHFAALKSVPDSVSDPYLYYDNNFNSLINILKCCEEYSIPNFIFSSSCSVYGNVNPKTLPVNENTILNPSESPYGHTKQVGEKMINYFTDKGNIKAILLRYFNPVGADISGLNGELPINRPNNLVPVITQTAAGILPQLQVFGNDFDTRDGSCVRDYVHVTDIAIAHIKALDYLLKESSSSNYEIFNLGTGNGVTVLEAIKAFEKVSGIKVNYKIAPRRKGDVAQIYSDNSKAIYTLGWEPKYSLEDMMATSWHWQQFLLENQHN